MPLFLDKNEDILSWLVDANTRHCMEASLCNLSELRDWHYSPDSFSLSHRTSRYFSIIGLEVHKTSKIDDEAWNQPIILQPEIGLLGLAIRRTPSGLQYLVQAKSEPGNLNSVQISPTIQATESNIDRVHGQSSIPLADLFLNAPVNCVVYDALQSEQGVGSSRRGIEISSLMLPGYRIFIMTQMTMHGSLSMKCIPCST